MEYRQIYELGKALLARAGIEEAAIDARLLLEYVCHTDRNTLLAHGDMQVLAQQEEDYRALLSQRSSHIPLQHLTGTQDFMGLEFQVNGHVLIPRQDTENLVEEIMRDLHDGMRILDMCTGSGCILISLLHYSNDCTGVGVDLSEEALKVARENARRLLEIDAAETLVNAGAQMPILSGEGEKDCKFVQSNLFENVEGMFDLIVSNPPYIRPDVIETLMPEVRDYEPRMALDGRSDGLYFYREIIVHAREHLARGGQLFFEIGYDQAQAVVDLFQMQGYKEITVKKDYNGNDRIVYATWYR